MTGKLVVHEGDNLDRQWAQRRVGEYTCGPKGRAHISLQLGRHQSGGESFSADVGAQDGHTLRVDDDNVVEITADDPRGVVHGSEPDTRHPRQRRWKQRLLNLPREVKLVFQPVRTAARRTG